MARYLAIIPLFPLILGCALPTGIRADALTFYGEAAEGGYHSAGGEIRAGAALRFRFTYEDLPEPQP